jgi:hypothetical protein
VTSIEWRPIRGFEGFYSISNAGDLRSEARVVNGYPVRERIVKPNKDKDGYLTVLLHKGPQKSSRRIHRLVLEAFVGPAPQGMVGCHEDGVPANCHLSNLRWDTQTANNADKRRHGTFHRGSACSAAKLTEEKVMAILADQRPSKSVARDYGVSHNAILQIRSGKTWAWLTGFESEPVKAPEQLGLEA